VWFNHSLSCHLVTNDWRLWLCCRITRRQPEHLSNARRANINNGVSVADLLQISAQRRANKVVYENVLPCMSPELQDFYAKCHTSFIKKQQVAKKNHYLHSVTASYLTPTERNKKLCLQFYNWLVKWPVILLQLTEQNRTSVQCHKVWLTPTTRVPCSNTAKMQNPLKFAWVPQTRQQISAVTGPKFTILSGHVEEVLLFNKVYSNCRYMP